MITKTLSQEIKEIGIKSHKYLKFVTLDSAEELDKFILKSKLIGMVVRDFRYRDTKGTSGMVLGDEMQCYIVENDTNIYFVYNKRFGRAIW